MAKFRCIVCSKECRVVPARLATAKFCSYACRGKWRTQNWTGPNHPQYQPGPRELICANCGKGFSQRRTEAISEFRKRKFCSMDCAKHGQKRLYGEAHPFYKVDSRRKNRRGKHGAWAREVISRDHATCQGCHAQNVEMHAHHIRPFAQHPELRWDVTNGQTLCYRCHWDHHTKDGEGPAGRIEESRVSSEGVTKEGRAFRRWVGQCTECEVFISRRFSDVKDKTAIFCSLACRGKWTSRIMKGKPRNLPFPKP